MANSKPGFNFKAIGYVLLWQSYWLPVLLIVAHDQWLQVRQLQPPDHPQQQPALPTPSQAKTQAPLASLLAGELLPADSLPVVAGEGQMGTPGKGVASQGTATRGTASQGPASPVTPAQVIPLPKGRGPLGSATLGAASRPLRGPVLVGAWTSTQPFSAQTRNPHRLAVQPPALQPRSLAGRSSLPLVSGVDRTSPVLRQFSGSELLGGPLTLQQPSQEPMSPLARAEQARLAQTGDPLAPVPARWREPMRRELQGLGAARLSQARVVHVPSERISRTVVLPLAVQHDGSIDALVAKDPAVSDRDLSDWASRQAPPARGSVQPLQLHLHPLPKGPVTAKATLSAPAPGPAVAEAPAAQAPASPGAQP